MLHELKYLSTYNKGFLVNFKQNYSKLGLLKKYDSKRCIYIL